MRGDDAAIFGLASMTLVGHRSGITGSVARFGGFRRISGSASGAVHQHIGTSFKEVTAG